MKKLIITIFVLIIISCDSKQDYCNDVYVSKELILTNEAYKGLEQTGNSIFINGGNKGIIIYRFSTNEYKAYDRSCTYRCNDQCSYIDSINSTVAYCDCCTSAFLLDQNGLAINGPALMSLTQYSCYLNGQVLRINNY